MPCKTVTLKAGMPTVAEAMSDFYTELLLATTPIIKIIHGWGASGRGGKIKKELQQELAQMKKEKQITLFIPGEKWDIFNEETQEILARYPEINKDSDLNRFNTGITIVLI